MKSTNKYLYKKIEQTKGGAYFENLIFIANEVAMQNQSESFEEFTELEPTEIATVLGWNQEESTLKLIQDEIKDIDFKPMDIPMENKKVETFKFENV